MIGLSILTVIAIWIAIVWRVATKVSIFIKSGRWQKVTKMAIFSVLVVAPFIDQIAGSIQLNNLCDNSEIHVRANWEAANQVAYSSKERELSNTIMPITQQTVEYLDVETGERIFGFSQFRSPGGLLVRHFIPREVSGSSCEPPTLNELYKLIRLKIKKV